MGFRDHYFSYIVVILLILAAAGSYYRFMVMHDYMVAYEGYCDPVTESCFVGCEDDECEVEFYFTEVERYAQDLYRLCGSDITDCEAADYCTDEEPLCSVTYCDPEVDADLCEIYDEYSDIDNL